MLVLSRKHNEGITIKVPPSQQEQVIKITVIEVRGDKVRIGVDADRSVSVHRNEVQQAIDLESQG